MANRKLGRGLDFLISGQDEGGETVMQISLTTIQPNPYQPRKEFRSEDLADLASSIREHGVLQPIIVRRQGDGYEIVAGERRFRASESLGLPTVPAIVRDATDADMLELALTENIQRADLNPLELARAYASYIDRFQLTQEQAAERLGKSRSSIANTMRLLELPPDVQEMISRGSLSMGHARALLALETPQAQRELAGRVAVEGLSVRDVERVGQEQRGQQTPSSPTKSSHTEDLEKQLRERLGTRVSIQDKAGRGRIVIEYFSNEELSRLLDILLEDASQS
jgi:ParB family chromosome partitioning protein